MNARIDMTQRDFVDAVRAHFDAVADAVLNALVGEERATLNLSAEETLFVRFNSNQVRQNTNVEQISRHHGFYGTIGTNGHEGWRFNSPSIKG